MIAVGQLGFANCYWIAAIVAPIAIAVAIDSSSVDFVNYLRMRNVIENLVIPNQILLV